MAEADATSNQSVDRGAIFTTLLERQALRRHAKLPLLDIRAEYEGAVKQALWRAHVEEHGEAIRAEVLAELRAKHGPQFGQSVGGLWAIRLLAGRRLAEMFAQVNDQRPCRGSMLVVHSVP